MEEEVISNFIRFFVYVPLINFLFSFMRLKIINHFDLGQYFGSVQVVETTTNQYNVFI